MSETQQDLARMRWRCRRGMRELDVLLLRFVDREYGDAPDEIQAAFKRLLSLQDPEILALLTGHASADDRSLSDVVKRLLATHHN